MAFATVQSGTIVNFGSSHSIQGFNINLIRQVKNITDGSATGTATTHKGGRYSFGINGYSHHAVSGSPVLPIGGSVSGGPAARIVSATIQQAVHIEDVTGPAIANGAREYTQGRIVYRGNALAAIATTETPLESASFSLTAFTLPISASHSIAGNAEIETGTYRNNHALAGQLWLPFQFVYTSTVTLNGTTPFSSLSYTINAALNNGMYWDGTALVRSQTMALDYRSGLPSVINYDLLVSGVIDADGSDG
jgi:hypothetical protein